MEAAVLTKIIEASPYLGFILLFMWFEAKREDKRITNATALETRREEHEKKMQERDLQHARDINQLWALHFQKIANEIKAGNQALIDKLQEHDEASAERYERLAITKDLWKMAAQQEKSKR
jgi:hypothetical protein